MFLFHQIGSFLGGWLGGVVYDRTGNYDLIWQGAIVLSLLAAALNWPVRERPVARLQAQMEAASSLKAQGLLIIAGLILLVLAWWGWQRGGLALMQLGMSIC